MVGGQWTNADGLPLNFGVNKALPELAGDYLAYGETRVLEAYITYGQTYWGQTGSSPIIPVMANSTFNGTGTPQTAGIISLTYDFPLQVAKVGTGGTAGFAATSGTLAVNNTQIWVDEMSFEVLSPFTGTANAFGIGLVMWNASSSIWQIVLPNGSGSGIPNHFLQVTTIGNLATAGQRWTWNSDAAAAPWGSTSSSAPTVPAAAWLGNLPQAPTNTGATSNTVAYLAAMATAAPNSTSSGLAKFRLKYNIYGNIVQ